MKKILKNLISIIAILLITTWLTACTQITQENFDKIQVGMTMQQVVQILGEPNTSESINILGISGTSAQWKTKDTVITIQFVNNKVQVKTFNKVATPKNVYNTPLKY